MHSKMSKKQFKSSASAARAFGTSSPAFGFSASSGFATSSSPLSYLNELPDLSSISDSNIVVAFKNLSKRDATTKTKALEDLQGLQVDSGKDVEEGVLDAWTNIYPRTSIDTSRRVRQLAHTLQGHIAVKSGKRIAKRMPSVVGAWLAGLYDSDKAVARAASDALGQVFTTPEKREALWKAYQESLLDFCRDVFDKESPNTLSDERNVSPDEANAKYHRVVTSAVGLLSRLISELKADDFNKNIARYTEILQDKKLWEKALSEEVGVRRSVHKMLRNLLHSTHAKACLDLAMLSKIYFTKGLDSDQAGSAGDFIDAVISLTSADTSIWTDQWHDKKPPSSGLKALVKRGSQGAALNYWANVVRLFKALPTDALPTETDKARELSKAFHSGVTRKDEPRSYVAEGLKAYIQVTVILSSVLDEGEKSQFLQDSVSPMISQYILPKADNAKWNVPPHTVQSLVAEMTKSPDLVTTLFNETSSLSAELIREVKLSLPEQAKDYSRSQDDLGKAGERFASLVAAITPPNNAPEKLDDATSSVLNESLTVLLNRTGKPYGAATVAAAVIKQCRPLIDESDDLATIVEEFLDNHIAMIYVSPSYRQLAAILAACEDQQEVFMPAWTRCLNAVLGDHSEIQFAALTELLLCRTEVKDSELEHLGPLLAPEILPKVDAIWTSGGEWNTVLPLLANSSIASKIFGGAILERITLSLVNVGKEAATALEGLRLISKSSPSILKSFLGTEHGKKLLPNLLLLSESPDERISKEGNDLIPVMQGLLGDDVTAGGSGNAVVEVIQSGLDFAGPTSVSVDTLVNHAKGLLGTNNALSSDSLLPNTKVWSQTLQHFLDKPMDKSLSMTSPLGGTVYLAQSAGADTSLGSDVERDAEGFSVPLRMAMYAVKLFSSISKPVETTNPDILRLLTLTVLMANDQLSVFNKSNLWSSSEPEVVEEVSEFVARGQQVLKNCHDQSATTLNLEVRNDLSTESYYLALAGCKMQAEKEEAAGASSTNTSDLETALKNKRAQGNIFATVSELYGHQLTLSASSTVMRYCNELVADLTPFDAEKLQQEGLRQLVVLNTILTYYEDAGETIAKPRLSRLVSKAVSWLQDESVDDELVTEIYRMMIYLLPLVSDMYGDYWKNILESIKSNFELVSELPDANAPALIPAVHASLRLFAVLRRIKSGESSKDEDERNDDVIEAWSEYENEINIAMINCLNVTRNVSDEQHQPLLILNELLSREISRIPTSKLTGVEDLYPQLYSPSPAVQQAAYRLLHRYIPSKQEQISLDTVLEKKSTRLPDELLSLILEAPVAAGLHDEDFERSVPLQLRGYLLSWLLIFDHFTNASHKVKRDYVESMKEAGHLNDFLDFAFDFLGHGRGKPIDVSKYDVASYNSSAMEDAPLKDTQWLLTHLYYLCLTHFPALSKTWWIECKVRQKVISVESWTAKHVSPLVISTALEAVATWSATQETAHTSEEPPALIVRVNHRASELSVAYPMDDEGQSAVIVVALPPTFPLHNAKVTSPSKSMAVDERRWNAWLLNSQAIIAFSNNSIVDGLLAWRRNVFGALKGQTECAICYSVVGEDGRVPSKKCRTCKNSFHGGCLFKWFKSSNGTSCPLCRESFNYG